jgi:tryptophan-rich sensory protein
MKLQPKPVLVAAAAALALGLLGGLMTDTGAWYRALAKPAWQPPDWAFGPAWTLIFALTALAAVYAWQAAPSRAYREGLLALFALNAFLNLFWSLLFFRLQRPDWALIEVGFLFASVALLVLYCARASRRAAWLLAPYLLWVAFATTVNWGVVRLNPPFG